MKFFGSPETGHRKMAMGARAYVCTHFFSIYRRR